MKAQRTYKLNVSPFLVALFSLVITILPGVAAAQPTHSHLLPDEPPSGDERFISPDATLELVVNGDQLGITFTEGVSVACDGMCFSATLRLPEFRVRLRIPKVGYRVGSSGVTIPIP